jgi:PPOX class probable F420-dependent enzyme
MSRDRRHISESVQARLPAVIDESTEFGARAARRLREERIAWLTTVDTSGTPQPIPVWFLWDGEASVLVYSQPATAKLRNLARNPRTGVHLDGDGEGGDIVVLSGEGRISDDPPADRNPEYVRKYEWGFERNGWTPGEFAQLYSVPIRIELRRLRGH